MDIEIYTSPTCGYCHQAKRFFQERGVRYTEYDVARDREAASRMVRLTGQMGVPVIIVDRQVVIGFDRFRLERLLGDSGNGHRPKLGLKVADGVRFSGHEGAYVGVVESGSLAERAGLRAGDTIVSIDTNRVLKAADLEELMGRVTPGSQVTIVYVRNNRPLQARLTV